MKLCLAVVAMAVLLPAQKIGFATVTTAGAGERVYSMMPFQRAVALGADGKWYLLVDRQKSEDPLDVDLELWRSAGGSQWQLATTMPTQRDGHGAIVAEPGRSRLHVVWESRGATEFVSVFYRAFDLDAQQGIGAPVRLAEGTGPNDHYFANDLCLSAGKLIAAIGAHRDPKSPGFSDWGTGLRVLADLDAGSEGWSPARQVNVGTCGVWSDLAEHDGIVHTSYRTFSDSGHCIAARAFNVERDEFVGGGEVRVTPERGAELSNANASLTAVDEVGHRYVMTILGADQQGKGKIVVAHAAPGSDDWTTIDLCNDPPQRGGNYNPRNLALARGPGNQMLAFYSKQDEQYATLYVQVLDTGRVVATERTVERGVVGAFEQLCGVRQSLRRMGVQLVVTGSGVPTDGGTESPATSVVRVYGLLR